MMCTDTWTMYIVKICLNSRDKIDKPLRSLNQMILLKYNHTEYQMNVSII